MPSSNTPQPPAAERDSSACGVGFLASRIGESSHAILVDGLSALACQEHRGACNADRETSDGAGVMTDIPFALLGIEPERYAVATLFVEPDEELERRALRVFERTLAFHGLVIAEYRDVPVEPDVLGPQARESLPAIKHVFIRRSPHTRTTEAFETLLHVAKQRNRTKVREAGLAKRFSMPSLSSRTIVYKALTTAGKLADFYPDLRDESFTTRFTLFHRRFSTNTRTTWPQAQPFRLIAHNGEINTIAGNRSWSYSREQDLGVAPDELLTHGPMSDSGSLNEMLEALRHRSSIPHVEQALAILMPPATERGSYYRFWGRCVEPWDGPAFVTYCDGARIGARLDRNGFRPCRWALTDDRFHLSSEAGSFTLDESAVRAKGTLAAGSGVTLDLETGEVHSLDPSRARENAGWAFDPRLVPLKCGAAPRARHLDRQRLFGVTKEEIDRILVPMAVSGKEPVGSMGDTARLAIFSDQPRSLFDYVVQSFAQVTNPPLDVLREMLVTDLSVVLGKRPNVFVPKELIPPDMGVELTSPVLSLAGMEAVRALDERDDLRPPMRPFELAIHWQRAGGARGLGEALQALAAQAVEAVESGHAVLVLSDRGADHDALPIPSLLALRACVNALNRAGLRLRTSIVVDTADARTAHHVAALVGFGASAVCPYLCLEIAREGEHRRLDDLPRDEKEQHVKAALELGLLKVMSKMGISVVRSYQSAKRFTLLGLSQSLVKELVPGTQSPIGGLGLEQIAEQMMQRTQKRVPAGTRTALPSTYQLMEHARGKTGERHGMTSRRSRVVHQMVAEPPGSESARALYDEFVEAGEEAAPVQVHDLLDLDPADEPLSLDDVESRAAVCARFGSGAMSFGAISAQSQRDIFEAMARIGGRSNSGEGGENPYYHVDGTHASTKQIASGRFGVTAEYLVTGDEIEIKIAQGAKPGEGGQLMGVKVDEDIAHARHATPGVSLISPAPLHDIYSIEDLKQLIYELKQLAPDSAVCVKLVAGSNIGTIACGVVKAGADVIQISGGSGGTGAASISSMKHAGLPWELGLVSVHRELSRQGLRDIVRLRVDGGLSTGRDVVVAAALGADEMGFGKLLLVAAGCIMARICEKNRCPRGIATHDPHFLKRYRGSADDVVALLEQVADDVRRHLARIGVRSLGELRGRARHLRVHPRHAGLVTERGLDLSLLLTEAKADDELVARSFAEPTSELNERLVELARPALEAAADERPEAIEAELPVRAPDRAVLARLAGELGMRAHRLRMAAIQAGGPGAARVKDEDFALLDDTLRFVFRGSAGQGFAAFLPGGVDVHLEGEANDGVGKSMSGGRIVVVPPREATFRPEDNVILGNCCLYGATGGALFARGGAGDRFAVRLSGAEAVVEGAGLHACEYMTSGVVLILGAVSHNVGAGMSGGVLYLPADQAAFVNEEFVVAERIDEQDERFFDLLSRHHEATGSDTARAWLADPGAARAAFRRFVAR